MEYLKLVSVVSLLAILSFFGGAPEAVAVECTSVTSLGDGMTCDDGCIDNLFDTTEGGELNCTANDVRVSGVADVTGDGIVNENDITFLAICDVGADNAGANCSLDPNVCQAGGEDAPDLCGDKCAFPGDTTTFGATFIFELSAQERFDISAFFAIDGDPNADGALTGRCSISTLPEVNGFTRPDGTTGNFVDLDTTCTGKNCPQPDDLCGDIDDANSPIFYNIAAAGKFITATCVDFDGNGQLNLPNCTSWRQSGANEECRSPLNAFPGSPSKCNCDPDFEVPIEVPAAELQVVKTASPSSVPEPGGTVNFDVAVTNTGIDPSNNVTLNSLLDDIYGDITTIGHDGISSTTCSVPQILTGNGGTYTCSFTVDIVANASEWPNGITDTVVASGVDDNSNGISGSDDATVNILDVIPAISVTKTASPLCESGGSINGPACVQEPGGDVTFTVTVNNNSTADQLTIISLKDLRPSPIGVVTDLELICLDGGNNSLVGQTIPIGGSVTCTFTVFVDGEAFESETDTVTAIGIDDEFVEDATTPDNKVSASESATVNILDDVPEIGMIKTASPDSFFEPGTDVTFSWEVSNLSKVDTVHITSLVDDVYGDLSVICNLPIVIDPGSKQTCSYTTFVPDGGINAITPGPVVGSETNTATATGVDDDGTSVGPVSDSATVNIKDVPPAASLTKTPTMTVVTFDVIVTNDSTAESLSLDSLFDDQFGDITKVQGNVLKTTCAVPQTIAVGNSYSCSFDGKVNSSPHTDTVTGAVSDDEGGSVTPSDSATVTFHSNP